MVRRIIFSILILTGAFTGFAMTHPVVAQAQEDPAPDPTDSPTPEPTPDDRPLDFSHDSGGVPDGSNIAFFNGYGSAKTDGSSIEVCIGFTNTAPVAATMVHFDFVVSGDGGVLGDISLDRSGTFSPKIAIRAPENTFNFNSDAMKNCVDMTQDSVPFSIADAQSVDYRVTGVDYADGNSWGDP